MSIIRTVSTSTTSKVTSSNAAGLSTRALALIGTIRKAEETYNRLMEEAADLGIEIDAAEGESELALLQKLSVAATSKAHDLAKSEDLARIERVAEGKVAAPRTGLAGLLARASEAVARI